MALSFVPRDRGRRRRFFKRLTNIVLIVVVSAAIAYVITKPMGGTGFRPSTAVRQALTASIDEATRAASKPSVPNQVSATTINNVASGADNSSNDGGYKLKPGPYEVSEVPNIVLHDAKRGKDLRLRVFYPAASGQYPLIVFSHGAGGSQNCCDELTKHWASYGYVTIQPTHEDSAVQRRDTGEENIRFLQAVRDALMQPALWESRPQDISLVLDSLAELQQRITGLSGKIDARHIGVGGHSMGSFTAEAVAGATVDLPGKAGASFADPRVQAALALSPQGPGQFGLTQNSFRTMRTPFLGITRSQDSLGPLANVAWHEKPFELAPAGGKYFLNISGANHMSFISAHSEAAGKAQQAQLIFGYTNSAALAFWDGYLKNEPAAKKYLQSDRLKSFSNEAAVLECR
jgi:predicted dienelactone hydrolase